MPCPQRVRADVRFPVSTSWLPSDLALSPHHMPGFLPFSPSFLESPPKHTSSPNPCLGLTFCKTIDDSWSLRGMVGMSGKVFTS